MKIFLAIALLCALIVAENTKAQDKTNSVTILFDNYVSNPDSKSGWGFSCLVEFNSNKVLFDAGGDETIYASNVSALDVDISDISYVVFSHEHGDHIAALNYILNAGDKFEVYVPVSFSADFENRVMERKGSLNRVKSPMEFCKGIYLTGEMGDEIKEQSMILDTEKGLIIITGCSHPGIVSILNKAREILNKDIYMVIGGFHLGQYSSSSISEIIEQFRKLGVKKCGATHCTGETQIQMFRDAFGSNFIELGTGKKIEL